MLNNLVPKRRRFQFGLRGILAITALLAFAFSAWIYNKPCVVSVTTRYAAVDAAAAQEALAKYPPHTINGSIDEWIILNDGELNDLLRLDGKSTALSDGEYPQSTFFSQTNYAEGHVLDSRTRPLEQFVLPIFECFEITGVIGAYGAGKFKHFLLDCNVNHVHTDIQARTLQKPNPQNEFKSRLLYNGLVTSDHLVFLAPVGDDTYHVIVFDLK